jgi:hypothetical protein
MGQPKIQIAFDGWMSSVTLIKVASVIADYEKVSTDEEIGFNGVVQPLNAEQLQLKPLDQRSWQWLMIHTRPDVFLKNGDFIKYDGKEFKVMEKKDYSLNNYIEYHIVKSYE